MCFFAHLCCRLALWPSRLSVKLCVCVIACLCTLSPLRCSPISQTDGQALTCLQEWRAGDLWVCDSGSRRESKLMRTLTAHPQAGFRPSETSFVSSFYSFTRAHLLIYQPNAPFFWSHCFWFSPALSCCYILQVIAKSSLRHTLWISLKGYERFNMYIYICTLKSFAWYQHQSLFTASNFTWWSSLKHLSSAAPVSLIGETSYFVFVKLKFHIWNHQLFNNNSLINLDSKCSNHDQKMNFFQVAQDNVDEHWKITNLPTQSSYGCFWRTQSNVILSVKLCNYSTNQ